MQPAISSEDISDVIRARENEETSVSKTLKELYGLELFSLGDILNRCRAYRVDENKDGIYDYISLINSKTKKEEFRLIKNFKIELEPGNEQSVTVLFMDITEDGEMDVSLIDYDLDNRFDVVMVDIDFDGEPDIIGIDSEGKGVITEAWIL